MLQVMYVYFLLVLETTLSYSNLLNNAVGFFYATRNLLIDFLNIFGNVAQGDTIQRHRKQPSGIP